MPLTAYAEARSLAPCFSRMTFLEQLTFPDWFLSDKIIESNALCQCKHLDYLFYGFMVEPLGVSESVVKICL